MNCIHGECERKRWKTQKQYMWAVAAAGAASAKQMKNCRGLETEWE